MRPLSIFVVIACSDDTKSNPVKESVKESSRISLKETTRCENVRYDIVEIDGIEYVL